MTFFLTSVFVFLVFWRPQEWLVPWLFGWPILDGVVFGSMLTLLMEVDQGRIKISRNVPQIAMLVGLWFATLMSHIANTYFQGLLDTLPETYKICLFTILLIVSMDTPRKIRVIALLFVAMACTMAIHALMQERTGSGFAGQPPLWIPEWGDRPARTRSMFFGIFGDPNDLSQFLVTAIPFTFALTWRRSFIGFLLGVGLTWLLLKGIIATDSRGGYVGLAVVTAAMITLILPARWYPFLMSCVLAGMLVLCPLSAAYLDTSAHDRVVFWGMANWQFKAHPIFGIGYGMFWQVASDRAAHNAFVSCYTTLGLFGYWFWFGLLVLGFAGAWRARLALRTLRATMEQSWLRRFSGLCMAAAAGFCASAYFLSREFIYPMFFIFALLAVVPAVTAKLLPADHPPFFRMRRDVAVYCTLGCLLSVGYVYYSILLLNKAFGG